MADEVCMAWVTPIQERRARACGRPATHIVGFQRVPRCSRHAMIARKRGELVAKIRDGRKESVGV